jgi:hypothetical protein
MGGQTGRPSRGPKFLKSGGLAGSARLPAEAAPGPGEMFTCFVPFFLSRNAHFF